MTRKDLSLIIPVYNEAENLKLLLPEIMKTLQALSITYEVLVVDTAQPRDYTQEVCDQNGAVYLRRKPNDNFANALRTGFLAAVGERTICMDGDGSHVPAFLTQLYTQRSAADVVIASRYVAGGGSDNQVILKLMSRVLNLSYSWVFGLNCNDISNSFKLYQTAQLKNLTLECDHFDVIEEILYKLRLQNDGLRILEIPYHFKERALGKTKRNLVLFMATYVFTMAKLRFFISKKSNH